MLMSIEKAMTFHFTDRPVSGVLNQLAVINRIQELHDSVGSCEKCEHAMYWDHDEDKDPYWECGFIGRDELQYCSEYKPREVQ